MTERQKNIADWITICICVWQIVAAIIDHRVADSIMFGVLASMFGKLIGIEYKIGNRR